MDLNKIHFVTDIDECDDPAIAARCVEHAECCNLPAHFLCKCLPGFTGDGEVQCTGFEGDPYTHGCLDMDECSRGQPCGRNALCTNLEGSFRCACPPGFIGDPMSECTGTFCMQTHKTCTYIVNSIATNM
nr:unnamed protein product [Callosobruchus chinensis]